MQNKKLFLFELNEFNFDFLKKYSKLYNLKFLKKLLKLEYKKLKCDSVKDMIRILNTHPAYEEFRTERSIQMDQPGWDYQRLLAGITAWSTNPKYADIIWSTIVDNNLP